MTLTLVTTRPTDAEFLSIFNRLCVALREQQDDSGVTQGIYFDALKDLPIAALDEGAAALAKQGGRRFFPTTAEWREAAEVAHVQQLKAAVQPARDEPWHLECEHCEDTGWERFECTGDLTCGRRNKHFAHVYARACTCRPTNRTYQRHAHFGAGA